MISLKTKTKGTNVLFKTILFIIFLIIDITMIYSSISIIIGVNESKDITRAAQRIEEYYYEKNYTNLLDYVDLYEFYGDDVKVYKEACDAYVLKMSCTIFADSNDSAEYQKNFDRLSDMLDSCDPQNEKIIAQFIEDVQNK